MRLKEREIVEIEDMIKVVDKNIVCRVGMVDEGKPYIVPMNFGYTYQDNILEFYFHSARKGRKIDVLEKNPVVCFEIDCNHKLVRSEIPCNNGCFYECIMGEGKITFIEDYDEKVFALNRIMKNTIGKEFEMDKEAVNTVKVYKLTVETMTGKKGKL